MLIWVYCLKMALSYDNVYSHYKTQSKQKCKFFHYNKGNYWHPLFCPVLFMSFLLLRFLLSGEGNDRGDVDFVYFRPDPTSAATHTN